MVTQRSSGVGAVGSAGDGGCQHGRAGHRYGSIVVIGIRSQRAQHVKKMTGPPEFVSTPGRDRTCDPLFRRQLLYPLSYGGIHQLPKTRHELYQNCPRHATNSTKPTGVRQNGQNHRDGRSAIDPVSQATCHATGAAASPSPAVARSAAVHPPPCTSGSPFRTARRRRSSHRRPAPAAPAIGQRR